MVFNSNTMTYIEDFKKRLYNKETSIIFCKYNKRILKEFITFNIEYLKEFLKCLDELFLKVPSIDNRKRLKEINIFKKINKI